MTKNKIQKEKILIVKGRKFLIKKYFDGILKFDFKDLCAKNVGAEDYIKIAKFTKFTLLIHSSTLSMKTIKQHEMKKKLIFLAIY